MANLDLGEVESFTAGTVGPKGQRVFYLQAQSNGTTFVFRLEKQQVLAMAEHPVSYTHLTLPTKA